MYSPEAPVYFQAAELLNKPVAAEHYRFLTVGSPAKIAQALVEHNMRAEAVHNTPEEVVHSILVAVLLAQQLHGAGDNNNVLLLVC